MLRPSSLVVRSARRRLNHNISCHHFAFTQRQPLSFRSKASSQRYSSIQQQQRQFSRISNTSRASAKDLSSAILASCVILVSAAAIPIAQLDSSSSSSGGRPKVYRFGPSIQQDSTWRRRFITTTSQSTSDPSGVPSDEDYFCPVCAKYSQGPCGQLFPPWNECAEAHPGPDPERHSGSENGDGEPIEWHLRACRELAEPLRRCIKEHEDYYANPENFVDDKEDFYARKAWTDFIASSLNETERRPFPRKRATIDVEIRPKDGMGMVVIPMDIAVLDAKKKQTFVFGYVLEEHGDGEATLLAAGSAQDVWTGYKHGYGILRFSSSTVLSSTVTVHTVFREESVDDDKEGTDVMYAYSVSSPTQEKKLLSGFASWLGSGWSSR